MDRWIKQQLVMNAFMMASKTGQPSSDLSHHSEQGAQYASKAFRHLLNAHRFQGSMSRRGNCWDNAVVESFFGSLKQERVQWCCYQTRYEAQQDVLNYISMFYNRSRLHSYLGYISPNDFESQLVNMPNVA